MLQHCHRIAVLHYPGGQEVVGGWTGGGGGVDWRQWGGGLEAVRGWTGQCQAGGASKHSIRSRTYVQCEYSGCVYWS